MQPRDRCGSKGQSGKGTGGWIWAFLPTALCLDLATLSSHLLDRLPLLSAKDSLWKLLSNCQDKLSVQALGP
jgi:hypothetical protein